MGNVCCAVPGKLKQGQMEDDNNLQNGETNVIAVSSTNTNLGLQSKPKFYKSKKSSQVQQQQQLTSKERLNTDDSDYHSFLNDTNKSTTPLISFDQQQLENNSHTKRKDFSQENILLNGKNNILDELQEEQDDRSNAIEQRDETLNKKRNYTIAETNEDEYDEEYGVISSHQKNHFQNDNNLIKEQKAIESQEDRSFSSDSNIQGAGSLGSGSGGKDSFASCVSFNGSKILFSDDSIDYGKSKLKKSSRKSSIDTSLIIRSENEKLIKEADIWVKMLREMFSKPFDSFEKIYTEKKQSHKLNMYFNCYLANGNHKISRLRCDWYVPCSPEQFIKFMNNVDEQKKIDSQMDDYKLIDEFGQSSTQCYSIYYLSYKKVLIASPRDFVYLKHHKKVNDNLWIDCSKSIIRNEQPEVKFKQRAELILCGHMVELDNNSPQSQIRSKVSFYAEFNLKNNVPNFMAKSFASNTFKQYIEKCIERIKMLNG